MLDQSIWERKYIDLWTLVHVLTGMCFGFVIFFYKSPFIESFITFVIFAIIWETVEFYDGAKEEITNKVFDVLAGGIGFLTTTKLIPGLTSSLNSQIVIFSTIYILVWTLAHYGFKSLALHLNRSKKKYNQSFSLAVVLYLVIMGTMFVLRKTF